MNSICRSALLLLALSLLLTGCLTNPNQPPTLLRGDVLTYPDAALNEGIEGEVVVRYDVSPEGRVINAEVVSGTPAGVFDEAALVAVSSWRFRPGRRKGVESEFTGMVSTIEFQFGEADDYPTR